MRIVNRTRQTIVAEHAQRAASLRQRMVGLLGRDRLESGEALWIVPCNSIHTCFMRFAIDAAFLDRDNRVVWLVQEMKPWRLTRIVRGAHSVLEVPAGTLGETGTRSGDVLEPEE